MLVKTTSALHSFISLIITISISTNNRREPADIFPADIRLNIFGGDFGYRWTFVADFRRTKIGWLIWLSATDEGLMMPLVKK